MHERRKRLRMPIPPDWHGTFVGIVLLLLVSVGAARIISTYRVFSQTTDEPEHLAAGMEWLERGTYTLGTVHPPLARVAVALGPYLSGLRLTGYDNLWLEGDGILLADGRYLRNLTLARLGTLPFFLFATLLVWYWARGRYGNGPALVATLLFTSSPVVLAHAGLATTDMAITACFTGALISYINLLERPTYLRSVILGIALGLATLSKFSALVFLPACGLALWVWRILVGNKKEKPLVTDQFQWRGGLALATLAMCLIVWAGYRFSVGPLTSAAERQTPRFEHLLGSGGALHKIAYAAIKFPGSRRRLFFGELVAYGISRYEVFRVTCLARSARQAGGTISLSHWP